MPDTGFPRADVENAFLRARRRQVLARLASRLRREPDDVNLILPFDEVIAALGRTGERSLGLQTIRLDTVVGTVDSRRDFDRHFRPTSGRSRERWERLALAQRRGEAVPPIEVYRVGDLHFVVDGHHRVSIALATGQKTIDAYVTEILTAVPARGIRRRADLLLKSYELMFRSRVPLPVQAYAKLTVEDPWSYAELGEAVEAWGFRLSQQEHTCNDRAEVARRWFRDEYIPVVRMLHAADLVGSCSDAEAYLGIARERYRLMRTHEWNDEVIEELRRQLGPSRRASRLRCPLRVSPRSGRGRRRRRGVLRRSGTARLRGGTRRPASRAHGAGRAEGEVLAGGGVEDVQRPHISPQPRVLALADPGLGIQPGDHGLAGRARIGPPRVARELLEFGDVPGLP
jgi:hypothetical protein